MTFNKMEPIKGGPGGCWCCGYQHEVLPLDAWIAVGFGYASLTKDGIELYSEHTTDDEDEFMTCAEAEEMAKLEPDHDWRIHLSAPLSERHYQRQGDNHWVLYEKGEGFA